MNRMTILAILPDTPNLAVHCVKSSFITGRANTYFIDQASSNRVNRSTLFEMYRYSRQVGSGPTEWIWLWLRRRSGGLKEWSGIQCSCGLRLVKIIYICCMYHLSYTKLALSHNLNIIICNIMSTFVLLF